MSCSKDNVLNELTNLQFLFLIYCFPDHRSWLTSHNMACTSQSAVDYIKQARIHLVRELKNPSVIVQNLYEREVLGDEEVSKIQAEKDDFDKNRQILDKVIKKGEAACYELLRIIDRTRKRTLERRPLPSERQTGAPPEDKTFDLHYWISCFSFKDDPQTAYNYLQGVFILSSD